MNEENNRARGTPMPFFTAMNRPFHVLGVDRALFFLFVGICLPIPFSAHFAIAMDGLALGLFVLLHTVGLLMTRADPNMLAIYRRHIHFKKYYGPQPGILSPVTLLKASVPFYQGKQGLV